MQINRSGKTGKAQETDNYLNTMGAAMDDGAAQAQNAAVLPETGTENAEERACVNPRETVRTPRIRPVKEQVSLKLFWAVAILCGIGIALCAGRCIGISNGSFGMQDEQGYWGNAAIFAGRDWYDIMALIPYYGYGYSFLLVPLFWLGLPMAAMYKIAVCMNTAMLLLAFALSYLCLRRLFTALQPLPVLLIAAATTLYTNTVVQAQIAWDETLLYLLYWLMFWLLLRLLEKPTFKWEILLALCGGYLYMVHMRTLGVMLALVLTVLLLWASHRLDGKHTLAFFAVFVLLLLLQNGVKLWINTNIYTGAGTTGANDYGGMAAKLASIFATPEGFNTFFVSLCGKLYYLGAATLLLAFASLHLLLEDFFAPLWKWGKEHFKQFDAHKIPSAFLLLSFGATLGVNVIAMQGNERLDYLIYGRYMEFAFGPLIAIGIALLVLGRISIGRVLCYSGLMVGVSVVTNGAYNALLLDGITEVNGICITTLISVMGKLNYEPNVILLITLGVLVLFGLMWGAQYACGRYLVVAHGSVRKIHIYRVIRPLLRTFLPMIIATAAWVCMGLGYENVEMLQKTMDKNLTQVNMLLDTTGMRPSAAYWIHDDTDGPDVYISQMQMRYEVPISVISATEFSAMELDENALYFATSESMANSTVAERGIKIIRNSWWSIYVVPGSMWETAAANMPLSLSGTDEFGLYYGSAANNEENTTAVIQTEQRSDGKYQTRIPVGIGTNGQQGVVVSGDTVNLPAGKYELAFTLTLQDGGGAEKLGSLLLIDEHGNHLKNIELNSDDFTPGQQTTIIMYQSTMLDEFLGETYFQLIAAQGVYMTLDEVVYARTDMANEVVPADTPEMDAMDRLLELDYEHHPIYALPRESQMERASVMDLQRKFPQWDIKVERDLSTVRDNPGILLVPTDSRKLVYELLAEYSILEKLGNYAIMVPGDSTIYSEFVGHGGLPMSSGYEVQLRYYAENSTAEAGTVVAAPPAGKYRLLMRPAFSNTLKGYYGSLTVKLDGVNVMSTELEKNEDRINDFYLPLVLTVDGKQEICVEINSDNNALLSNMDASLRLLGDGEATYGDSSE